MEDHLEAEQAPARADTTRIRWHRGFAAPALVFCTSAAVLVLEILAGRLVAPYVGVSLETYTGVIGTVLAGIAIGAALGGRIADRRDPRGLLGPLLIASGAASLLVLPIVSALGPRIADGSGDPLGIVTLAVSAFVLPTALLSAVPPMAAKLRLASTAETGTVVGGLSAAGTAGALVGTFLTGFVFVAALPTRPVVIVLGIALAVAGMAIAFALHRRPPVSILVVLLVVAGFAATAPSPCEEESRYYCVSVAVDPARPSGRTLILDNLRHSYVDLADPTHLEFRYSRLFAEVVDGTLPAGPVRALHIGGGGFTFPRWLAATRPGSTNTVLELDPGIVDIAERQLGLRRDELTIHTGDARVNITKEPARAYDLVVGDAFGGLSVPWHLTTVEMLHDIKRTMRPDGMYILNMIDAGPRRLVRAEAATLERVFDHVALIAPPIGNSGNYVLVGTDRPLTLEGVPAIDGTRVTGDAVQQFIAGQAPLRDDFAPADQLITRD
jgi:MFS family permease